MKTIAILAGLLFSTSVLSQQGGVNRDPDRDNDRRVHHRDHGTYTTVPRSYVPRVGAPDPYAPIVGAPDPYATKAGAPNPYATRGGDPVKPLPQPRHGSGEGVRGR